MSRIHQSYQKICFLPVGRNLIIFSNKHPYNIWRSSDKIFCEKKDGQDLNKNSKIKLKFYLNRTHLLGLKDRYFSKKVSVTKMVNSFITEVPIMQKPVHWFALKIH